MDDVHARFVWSLTNFFLRPVETDVVPRVRLCGLATDQLAFEAECFFDAEPSALLGLLRPAFQERKNRIDMNTRPLGELDGI